MALHAPSLTAASHQSVLLVFTPAASAYRLEIDRLLEKARSVLIPAVQIMRVSETTHPEVVRSFGFTSTPAFVLLEQGLELWRYSGPVNGPELFAQLDNQVQQTSPKTR